MRSFLLARHLSKVGEKGNRHYYTDEGLDIEGVENMMHNRFVHFTIIGMAWRGDRGCAWYACKIVRYGRPHYLALLTESQ